MQARALSTVLSTIAIVAAAPNLAQARGSHPQRTRSHGGVAFAAGASGGTPFAASSPASRSGRTGGSSIGARGSASTQQGRHGRGYRHGLVRRGADQLVLGVHAPITAEIESPAQEYEGPLFQRTSSGEVVPYVAPEPSAAVTLSTGGSPVGVAANVKPHLLVPGSTAQILEGGLAAAPMQAPESVQEMIWAGNEVVGLPYIYGGGHGSFKSPGYDCSGTVSYALHGASLIPTPMDSSEMMRWGQSGIGRWVTIFADPEHAYMTIAGLRLDTSNANDPGGLLGPRWRPLRPGNAGFVKRHPAGL